MQYIQAKIVYGKAYQRIANTDKPKFNVLKDHHIYISNWILPFSQIFNRLVAMDTLEYPFPIKWSHLQAKTVKCQYILYIFKK